MTEEKFKPRVPTLRELRKINKKFARVLEPNNTRTKLYGVDRKLVEVIERGRPDYCQIRIRPLESLGNFGDEDHIVRIDGSIASNYYDRLDFNGGDLCLTNKESQLVLGRNYEMIDVGYSSPSTTMMKCLCGIEGRRADCYNAFEIGNITNSGEYVHITLLPYRITKERFIELSNTESELSDLMDAVYRERSPIKR